MVNGRRVIGIIVGKEDNEGTYAYIRELYNHAKECDYITIVYNLLADFNETGKGEDYDYNMLHVLNFEYVDALIVIKDDFMPVSLVDAVVDYAKKNEKPRIVIGMPHKDAFSIEFQGTDSFETIVNHMVKDHNCRNAYFIGDIEDPEVSEECRGIYKKVIENNGIEYRDDRTAIINTQDGSIYDIIEEWIEFSERPDAIICSSDQVAMLTIRTLTEKGYLVPENILVSGYGYKQHNKIFYPRLTSTYKDEHTVSEIIMELLFESFNSGYLNNMVIKQQLQVQFSQTCGCETATTEEFARVTSKYSDRINNMEKHLTRLFELSGKMSNVSEVTGLSELFSQYIDPASYMVLRNAVWKGCADEVPSYDDSVTVIRSNTSTLTDQRRIFPLDIYDVNTDTLDQSTDIKHVHLLHFNNLIFGYYVTDGFLAINKVTRHMRFADISNINLNGVYNSQKLNIANEKLVELQIRDSLTGAYNYKGFEKRVEEMYLKDREGRRLIIISFDIDDLSKINNEFGHDEGDKALVSLAEIIRASASVDDCIARSGSDEYILAIATREDCEYIIFNYMKGFYHSLKSYNSIKEDKYELKVYTDYVIGAPSSIEEVNELVNETVSMKNIKKKKDKIVGDGETDENEIKDYELFKKLIDTNSFAYMFQPIVSAYTGEIFGYEALMRSVNDIQLSPLRILEIATKHDRLHDVERATTRNVYEQVGNHREEFKDRKVFINSIIGYALDEDEAKEAIGPYADLAKNVVVELTEQTDIPADEYIKYVTSLKEAGLQIAIDDFGTGYSNTSRLIEIVPNYVKIDRSLIKGIYSDYKKQHFVSTIIQYAHENGFMSLAEGVESLSELKCVIRLGVDLIQGYYTARPSFDIIDRIDDEIIRTIIKNSAKRFIDDEQENVYVANKDDSISLVKLRSDDCRQILISNGNAEIIGDKEATICNVTIADNFNGTIKLEDIYLKSNYGSPVIEIGNYSDVVLQFEGENYVYGGSIFVPESSKLTIVGGGKLKIENINQKVVGIGGLPDTAYGTMDINLPGGIEMFFAADTAIGIGGGYNLKGSSIVINNTPISINPAVANLLAIGCIFDKAKIHINDSDINIKAGVRLFVGIGSVNGDPQIQIVRSKLVFDVGGNKLCSIGSFNEANSAISIVDSDIKFEIHGKNNIGIGSETGACSISINACKLYGIIEGSNVTFVGSRDKSGKVIMTSNEIDVDISSENKVEYSVEEKNLVFINE